MDRQDVSNQRLAGELVNFLFSFWTSVQRPAGMYADLKINSRASHVLFMLKYHPCGRLTMSRLAQELHMPNQQLTKLVNSLEKRGLVERTHNEDNRRQVFVQNTEAGNSLYNSLIEDAVEHIIPEMEVFTPGERAELSACIETFDRLLGKIRYQQWEED